jgi:hypothetical protein
LIRCGWDEIPAALSVGLGVDLLELVSAMNSSNVCAQVMRLLKLFPVLVRVTQRPTPLEVSAGAPSRPYTVRTPLGSAQARRA